MKNQVLVTGCTGKIGRELTRQFLSLGYEVIGTHLNSECNVTHDNHTCIKIDLLSSNFEELFQLFKPRILIHTAWVTEQQSFWHSDDNLKWLKASIALSEIYQNVVGGYFIGIGSSAEYRVKTEGALAIGVDEGPTTIYGNTKLAFLDHLTQMPLKFAWCRVFNQFSFDQTDQKLIPSTIRSLRSGLTVEYKNPQNIYDFVLHSDVASNITKMVDLEFQGICNLGSGRGYSLKSIGEVIESHFSQGNLKYTSREDQEKACVVAHVDYEMNRHFRWTDPIRAIEEFLGPGLS
jgi:nucleoside-diphosphate-sugar epimerase